MTLYRNVLKEAWQITWRYKSLWPFGFLASFLGLGSAYEIIYQSTSLSEQRDFFWALLWQDMSSNGLSAATLKDFAIQQPLSALTLLLLLVATILIILGIYWIFTCSQITLIKSIDSIENKKNDLRGTFLESRKQFWPVFGINIGGKVLSLLLLLLLSYPVLQPLLQNNFAWGNFLLYLIFFIIIFILVLLISILMVYAIVYIALKKQSIKSAVAKAWQLFASNWLVSTETAFILFLASIAVVIAFFAIALLALIPFTLLFKIAAALQSVVGLIILGVLAILFAVILMIMVAALLSTFQLSVWVTLFERLENGTAESKLERLASEHLGIQK